MTKRERNKLLQEAIKHLDEAYSILDELNYEEQDSLNNWPESLQGTDNYANAEERANTIDEAYSTLEEIKSNLEELQ